MMCSDVLRIDSIELKKDGNTPLIDSYFGPRSLWDAPSLGWLQYCHRRNRWRVRTASSLASILTMPKFMDRHCIDSRSRDLRRRPKAGLGRRCSRLRRRAAEHRSRPGCSTAVPPPSTGRLQKPLSGFCARSRRYVPNVRPLSAPPRAMLVV